MSIAKALVHANVARKKNWLRAAIALQAVGLVPAGNVVTENNTSEIKRLVSSEIIINFD